MHQIPRMPPVVPFGVGTSLDVHGRSDEHHELGEGGRYQLGWGNRPLPRDKRYDFPDLGGYDRPTAAFAAMPGVLHLARALVV